MSKRVIRDADYDFETGEFVPAQFGDDDAKTEQQLRDELIKAWKESQRKPNEPFTEWWRRYYGGKSYKKWVDLFNQDASMWTWRYTEWKPYDESEDDEDS